VGNVFIIKYLVDACTQIKIYSTSGVHIRDVTLPGIIFVYFFVIFDYININNSMKIGIGSASGFGGARKDIITYYDFSSYAVPTSMYSYPKYLIPCHYRNYYF
jgi:hypothetical protein